MVVEEGIKNLNLFLKLLHTILPNYQDGWMKCLPGRYRENRGKVFKEVVPS